MADDIVVPEGYIQDFITGEFLKDTPKEYVRQDMAKVLFHEYNFRIEDMGRDYSIMLDDEGKKQRKLADIVIFPSDISDHSDFNKVRYIFIVEAPDTSPNNKARGIDILHAMMAVCAECEFGIWTNGTTERKAFRRIEKRFEYTFEEIIDIPGAGKTLEEIENLTKDDLRIAVGESLLHTFKRCHNYIAANQGIKKDQAFWELLKLIFCKIFDERKTGIEFYVRSNERTSMDGQQRVMNRVNRLFADVKKSYGKIFRETDEIYLNYRVVAYIVSQLQSYDLLRSPVDVKGTAYEEIVSDNLKGDRGQFFTPRNVIRMAVQMLNPTEEHSIIDPACGTGGFLVESLNHVIAQIRQDEQKDWQRDKEPTQNQQNALFTRIQEYAINHMYGVDFDPDLVKATQMNMVMNNDGQGHLFPVNSLDNPYNWPEDVQKELNLESFDIVLTNPPFGSKLEIDDPAVLRMYELARKWEKRGDGTWVPTGAYQKKIPPEILFIERCWQLLKPGTGKMGIVLPDGILSNPDLEYVRAWILRNCQILASIDLPVETFLPHTGTQTSMLFLRRKSKSVGLHNKISGTEDIYPVFMAIADKVGKDRRANSIYKRSPDGAEIWVDVSNEEIVWIDEKVTDDLRGNDSSIFERSGKYYYRRSEKRQIVRKQKVLDDDLPTIADAFRKFIEENRLEK